MVKESAKKGGKKDNFEASRGGLTGLTETRKTAHNIAD